MSDSQREHHSKIHDRNDLIGFAFATETGFLSSKSSDSNSGRFFKVDQNSKNGIRIPNETIISPKMTKKTRNHVIMSFQLTVCEENRESDLKKV